MKTPAEHFASIRAALPTSRHVEMVLEAYLSIAGADALVETANGGQITTVFRRDAENREWITPWPVISFGRGKRLSFVGGIGEAPSDAVPPARNDLPAPRLRGLTSGDFEIHVGKDRLTLTYGADGRIAEVSVSSDPEALARFAGAMSGAGSNAVDAFVDFLVVAEPGRTGPARVYLPAGCPAGAPQAWAVASTALRRALLADAIDPAARWVAVDGFAGTVVCPAATRAGALDRCAADIRRTRPRTPDQKPMPTLSPEAVDEVSQGRGLFMISTPASDAPRVDCTPENTPMVLLSLPAQPREAPPFGAWFRVLDAHGGSSFAALRRDASGLTAISADALARVDVSALDSELDAAEERASEWFAQAMSRPWPAGLPPLNSRCVRFFLEADAGGALGLHARGFSHSHGFTGGELARENLGGGILRQRWTAPRD